MRTALMTPYGLRVARSFRTGWFGSGAVN
jgi:hypothetical protein